MTTHGPAADAARASAPDARVGALVAHFETVAATAMRDMPVVHRGLRVDAIDFGPFPGEADTSGDRLGILIAPWFMNLVWLPPVAAADDAFRAPGCQATRHVGTVELEWIGAHAPGVGAYACCSLFSPMFEFADHASAVATARAALAQLRSARPDAPRMSRRAFMLRNTAAHGEGA
ncbi:Protein HoxT [Burkholderia multivorans]